MNKITELKQAAGLYVDTSGRWANADAVDKFANLIVEECCKRLGEETISHDGYGFNQHELYNRLRQHFGVKEWK